MIKAYLFGTPNGFNLYGDDQDLRNYFLGFYIGSRKGSRLMINRRDDGITFYSYLRYELVESIGRRNSFFGMCIAVDDHRYTPEVHKLYDWCEYLFEMVLKRGGMFHATAEGCLQYNERRFDQMGEEARFIVQNLPKIFQEGNKCTLLRYDNSFRWDKLGKVAGLNPSESDTNVIAALQQVPSVVIDKGIKMGGDVPPVELNLFELDEAFTRLSRTITEEVGLNPRREQLPVLQRLQGNMQQHANELKAYLPHAAAEQREQCQRLYKSFATTAANLADAIRKLSPAPDPKLDILKPKPDPKPDPKPATMKYCAGCRQQKPLTDFEKTTDTHCRQCKADGQKKDMRKCAKCGRVLPVRMFKGQSEYCRDCISSPMPIKKWALGAAAAVAVVAALFFLLKGKTPTLDSLMEKADFGKAYVMAQEGKQPDDTRKVKQQVDAWLVECLQQNEANADEAKQQVEQFFDDQPELPQEWRQAWTALVADWMPVVKYLNGDEASHQQAAGSMTAALPGTMKLVAPDYYTSLEQRFAAKTTGTGNAETIIAEQPTPAFSIVYTDKNGTQQTYTQEDAAAQTRSKHRTVLKGSSVIITSQGSILVKTKDGKTVSEGTGQVTIPGVDNIIVIFCNPYTPEGGVTFEPQKAAQKPVQKATPQVKKKRTSQGGTSSGGNGTGFHFTTSEPQ